MIIKKTAKKIKYNLRATMCVLRRTLFRPLYKIKVPVFKKMNFEKCVKIGSGTRVYLYNGSMCGGHDTVICNYSKFIIGDGKLIIGSNCLLGEYGIYNTFSDIIIGDNVITADRISFVTNIHHYDDISVPIKEQPSDSKSIEIGDGSWIGMNATILAGSKIGKNCIVAAHCVVKGVFPDYCVIAGVPGRVVTQYNFDTKKWEKIS